MLWLALSPQPPKPMDTGWDKLNHVLAFTALGVAARFSFGGAGGWRRLAGVAALLLAIGGGIEVAQAFLPPRSAELRDLAADALGIAAGLLLAAAAGALQRRRAGRRAPR